MARLRSLRQAGSLALALISPAAPAWAQSAMAGASASGTALAEVVAPIAVTREADLDFGTVTVSPTSGGTVSLAPLAATASYGGGVAGICGTACAAPHPARFAVQGAPGRAYQVTLPAQLALAMAGGGASVLVDSLVAAVAGSTQAGRGILSSEGRSRFEVGGTLHLPAAAPAAQYTIQVPVIVDYP